MSIFDDLTNTFTTDGNPTHDSSTKIGQIESERGWNPVPQQPTESWTNYSTRVNAYDQAEREKK